jgi:hypothetical protein
MRWLRRFWPIPAMLATVVAVQAAWVSRYTATGHAAEHLSSATSVFGVAFVVGVVIWGIDAAVRRRPELWVILVLVFVGAAGVVVGNVRVVDAIGTEDWSIEEAEALGSARPGFPEGHELAERAAWFTVAATVLLALWLWQRRAVSPWVGGGAVALSIVFPYWIFPGAGLVVLAVALVAGQVRAERLGPAHPP